MRKLIALTLALMLVLSAVAMGYAAPKGFIPPGQAKKMESMEMFMDLDGFEWAEGYINTLAGAGLLKGYGNGKFQPNRAVSNVEAVVMVLRMMGYDEEDAADSDYEFESGFNMHNIPEWALDHVRLAYELGILEGLHFNPNAAAKREAVAAMIANGLEDEELADAFMNRAWLDYEDAEDVDEEFVGHVLLMKRYGLMIGDDRNRFNPRSSLRRAEMAMLMGRFMEGDWSWDGYDYPKATVHLNDELDRVNVALEDLEIRVAFTEDVYDEDGEPFDEMKKEDFLNDIVSLTDSGDDEIELEVEDIDPDEWILVLADGEVLAEGETYLFEIADDAVYDEDEHELRGQTSVEFTTVDGRLRAGLVPEDGTTGVALDEEIAIEFSEEPFMEDNEDYVSFTTEEAADLVKITFEDFKEEDGDVDFDLELDGDHWILDFDLAYDTTYTVRLGGGNPVGDLYTEEGEDFTGDHVYRFSTVGNYALEFEIETLLEVDPELVDATSPTVVTIDFGKEILDVDEKPFAEDDLDELVSITPEAFGELATVEWAFDGDDTVVLTIDHLDFGTDYTVMVDESLLFGGVEGDASVTFTTREEPVITGAYTTPVVVAFTFDGPIVDEEGGSLEAEEYTVSVYEGAVDGDEVTGFKITIEDGTLTLTFDEGVLEDDEDYVVVLEGFHYNGGEAYGQYDEEDPFEFTAEVEETE